MRIKKNLITFNLLILFVIHSFAHFFPIERMSIGPDDLALLLQLDKVSFVEIILTWPDRPLHWLWAKIIGLTIGNNYKLATIAIYVSSFFPPLIAFFIFLKLFKAISQSFLLTLIFLLLPNKLEVYHTLIFVHINIVMSIYMLSILFFIDYLDGKKKLNLFISLAAYLIGIFWYETGFFLPALYFLLIFKKEKFLDLFKTIFPFVVIALLYLLFRYTGAFGFGNNISGRNINFDILISFKEFFHSFFGRYMIKNVIYGIYNFLNLPKLYMYILIFVNLFILASIFVFIRKKKLNTDKYKFLLFAILLIIISLMPNFLLGGIGGRNLVIPGIGFSIIIYYVIMSIPIFNKFLFIIFLAVGLFVSEGINWTHVISTRINNSVFNQLNHDKEKLINSNLILIDTKSFAKKIPHTFIKQDFNILNTYYGAQTFEDWGLKAMVNIILEGNGKQTYISLSEPITNDKNIKFSILKNRQYRSYELEEKIIENKNVYILDFNKVYGEDFNNGKFIFK